MLVSDSVLLGEVCITTKRKQGMDNELLVSPYDYDIVANTV